MIKKFESKPFYYKIWGDYALFTDPLTKGGGEKFSYSVPTYQALKGITESLYWKPTIQIFIDEVKIMRPIRTHTSGIRTLIGRGKENSNDRSYYTYLCNVEYLVKFHFEWNDKRPDLERDRNEIKHQEIILRTLEKGGRRDVFLGTRECVGFVDRITKDEYEIARGHYYNEVLSMGIMFHSFEYPHKNKDSRNTRLKSNFSQIVVNNGIIKFPRPEECTITNILGNYKIDEINTKIKSADEELREL